MKKSSKVMHAFISLFLSCVSSVPFSGVAMVPKSITSESETYIIDSDKPPLKDAMKFYHTLFNLKEDSKNNDLIKSINKKLNEKFMHEYLYEYLSKSLDFQKVAIKICEEKKENEAFKSIYQRALSYLVLSYRILEDIKSYFSTFLRERSMTYGLISYEAVLEKAVAESLIIGYSQTLKNVLSNKNIVKYTNEVIKTYNDKFKKKWPLFEE